MVDIHNQYNVIVYYQCYACQLHNIIQINTREHADINASQESVGVKFHSKTFQQEVGLDHVQCSESVNIRGIPK